MENAIKHSITTDLNTIRKGNFSIGPSPDVGYGDTLTTGFWQGINPPNNGYTLYQYKLNNGPSIFTPNDDNELIILVNMIGSVSNTTIEETLQFIRDDDDLTISNFKYEPIITHDLVLNIDYGYSMGYPLSGTTSYDLSIIQNNGILNGGTTHSFNMKGSIVLDGIDGYVSLGKDYINSGEIGTGDVSYTIESWIYLNSTPSSVLNSGWSVLGNSSSGGIGVQIFESSGIKVNFGNRGNGNITSSSSLSLNTWYHIVCTREVGVSNRIYINGVLDQTGSISDLEVNATSSEMQIGWADSMINGRFDGEISIVRLYKSHLTDSEVLNNYNAQKSRMVSFYVRPLGTTYGSGDGTSYNDAWSGFSSINWSSVNNNELIVSGLHTEKLTVGESDLTISFDTTNVTRIDGTGINEAFDIINKSNITINNAEVINASVSNLNIDNSLNIVTNDSTFNASGNQGIQHLGTSSATHNNTTCNDNVDDGFSAHDNCTVEINGGEASNNSEGIAFVNTCKFTVDGTILTGNTLNDITCRSNQENVFKNVTANVVVVDSPDTKVGITSTFTNCDITDMTVHNSQEIAVDKSVVGYIHTTIGGLGEVMKIYNSLIKRINSRTGSFFEFYNSRLLQGYALNINGTFKAHRSLIENTGGSDHTMNFRSGSNADINYCVIISAIASKYGVVFRTGSNITNFNGNVIDGKGVGRGVFVQYLPTIHNTIFYNLNRVDNVVGATYINCDFYNAGTILGTQTNCIYTDPLFVDDTNLDYTLGTGSGAIGSGLTVTEIQGIDTADWKNGTTEYPIVTVKDNTVPFDIGAYIS